MMTSKASRKMSGEKMIRASPAITTPMNVPGTNPVARMVIQNEVSNMSGMKFHITCVQ